MDLFCFLLIAWRVFSRKKFVAPLLCFVLGSVLYIGLLEMMKKVPVLCFKTPHLLGLATLEYISRPCPSFMYLTHFLWDLPSNCSLLFLVPFSRQGFSCITLYQKRETRTG